MDSVQYELVGEAGQEVPVGTWILCGGVQQQGPGCQVALQGIGSIIWSNIFFKNVHMSHSF